MKNNMLKILIGVIILAGLYGATMYSNYEWNNECNKMCTETLKEDK